MDPVIKWAGGKRQLLPEIRARVPREYGVYHEPFLGGGAVLLDLQPAVAKANDVNEGIINLLRVVRDDVDGLIAVLEGHAQRNSAEYFYEVRAWDRQRESFAGLSDVERAARMLYLNKTCFNGLHRVNSRGEFNVPFGRYKNPNIVNEKGLRAVHGYLAAHDVELTVGGFAEACGRADKGDFVYLDPPYDVVSQTSNFTGYAQGGFGRAEQEALHETCRALDARGVKFLLSNSATPFILGLYEGEFEVDIVHASRAINSRADKRGPVEEVLVRNY